LIILLLLPLTSCLPVEDFRAYWDQADLDPQIKGKWKRIAKSPDETREHGYAIGDITEFVEKDGAFEVITRSSTGAQDTRFPVKTFTTGRHRWLVLGRQKAVLLGYQVDGGYLDICPMGAEPEMAEFVEKNYPGAPNLKVEHGMGPRVHIKLFDATAFALLRDYPGADHCTEEPLDKLEKVQ
jgi:hypothetical protein